MRGGDGPGLLLAALLELLRLGLGRIDSSLRRGHGQHARDDAVRIKRAEREKEGVAGAATHLDGVHVRCWCK